MFKKVFLEHWIDWTIAIIIMVFIVVWGAVQQFSIEQDADIIGSEIQHTTKSQTTVPSKQEVRELELQSAWEQKAEKAREESKNWESYTNTSLGFTLKYPAKVDTGEIVFVSAGNIVFVTLNNTPLYKERAKLTASNDIDLLKQAGKLNGTGFVAWAIVVRDIESDIALDKFVKDMYGDNCNLGEKRVSEQDRVFDIGVQDHLDMEGCFINYISYMKYSPTLHKAISWDIGQDSNFFLASGYPADHLMVNSFRFITN